MIAACSALEASAPFSTMAWTMSAQAAVFWVRWTMTPAS